MDVVGFYERVKFLSKSNKTTIEHTVGKAGLSLASYNAYRRRENLPRADEALRIAQALGTTVEYLVEGNSPKPATADEVLSGIENFIRTYRKSLKPAQRKPKK